MRLRWITALGALVITASLIGAILMVGREVLNRNYAALEREDAVEKVDQVCTILQSQLEELNVTTHDYAAWDTTYDFMVHPTPRYASSEISGDVFRSREIELFMLVDTSSNVVLAKPFSDHAKATLAADVDDLLRAVRRRSHPNHPVVGLLTLSSGPAMVAIRPVLTTRNTGPARGTLVMVRDIGPAELTRLSKIALVPIFLSGTAGNGADLKRGSVLKHNDVQTLVLGDNRLASSTQIRDLWGQPRIRLQIDQNRNIWLRGQTTIRALVGLLIVVGVLFAAVSVWIMQRLVCAGWRG